MAGIRSIEADRVRIEVLTRGMDDRTAAAGCGVTLATFQRSLANSFPWLSLRFRVEALFDYEIVLWSSPATLKLRRDCVARHGFDPYTLNAAALRTQAERLRINITGRMRASDTLLDAVVAWLAANLNSSKKTV